MKIHFYIPVLLLTLLFTSACQEEKPEKSSVKKQFFTEKNTLKIEEALTPDEDEITDDAIFTVSQSQFDEFGMKIGKASLQNVKKSITAAGYIEVPNENKAEVRSYIGGYLQSTPLLPGDYVNKDQLLISLSNLEYIQLQQEYLQAKEELVYLKEVYERKKTLAEENITSINSRQQAESEYNIMKTNVEGLRKKLQLININPDKISPENISSSINLYAPISGFITMVKAVKGQFVEPTDIIFEIINCDHLHLELKVYEKDILKVKKGQKIAFRIPEADSKDYSGEVFLVGKTIDEADRTVTVHCHITDENKIPVVIGMYIEAEIFVDSHEKFCLPVEALIREESRYYAFMNTSTGDDGYTFKKIHVEVGEINEDCIEITGKSRQQLEGKELLVEGAFNL
jgi:cobalt-zinc-cadmium efflux system membrane fusion protein